MSAQARYSGKRLGAVSSPPASGASPSMRTGVIDGLGRGGRQRVELGASGSKVGMGGRCDALRDDIFDCGRPGHTELYRRSREAMLDYIRVTFDEGDAVAQSIVSGTAEYPSKPTDPPAGASRTDEEIWKRRVAQYVNAQSDTDKGLKQAYTLMWGQCSQRLKDKLETNSRYAIVSASKDVIALDQMIRKQAHETMDSRRKKAWTALEAKLDLLNFRQEAEKLTDVEFYREFAGRVQGLKTAQVNIGRDDCVVEQILAESGTTLENATLTEKDAAYAVAEGQSVVMLYFKNIHQSWHGPMVRYLEDAFATGTDLYPTSLAAAYSFLDDWKARHRIRGVFTGRGDGIALATAGADGKHDERFVVPGKEHVLCWDCNYYGHGRGNKLCPNYDPSRAREGKAKDGNQVHATAGTPLAKGIEISQAPSSASRVSIDSVWSGPQGVSAVGQSQAETGNMAHETTMCTVVEESYDVNFSFFQGSNVAGDVGDYILLDNQSTCHVFKDRALLSGIREAPHPIVIHSTGGTSLATQVGYIRNFPDPVWICETGIANILSFARIQDAGCRITYDSAKDCFKVQGPTREIVFRRLSSGLYGHRVQKTGVCLVDTVDIRAEGYTPRQVAAGRVARKAISMMGSPSVSTMKVMVRDNLINNCPVTVESLNIADDIFGPDVASIQGKMARRRPAHVGLDEVEVPPEIFDRNSSVVVVADVMFVNGLAFLVSVSRGLTLVTVSYLATRDVAALRRGMLQIVSVYRRRGFRVHTAMVDNQFDPLRGQVGDVDLNVTAAAEHAPEIERAIRTIKERVRAQKCRLPFSRLPARVVINLVSFCVFWINAYPHKNSISSIFSPRTIITGRKLDYTKHCRAEFGAYAQVYQHTSPHNSTDLPRAVSALVMGPTGNAQGSYKFYNLDSGRQLVANQFVLLPMPREVIDRVHAIADSQNMPADLLFTDADGNIIGDDDPSTAPPPVPAEDHRSVNPRDDPAAGLYMGLHHPDMPGDLLLPPEFQAPPAVAGHADPPPVADDNFFAPLADDDDDDEPEVSHAEPDAAVVERDVVVRDAFELDVPAAGHPVEGDGGGEVFAPEHPVERDIHVDDPPVAPTHRYNLRPRRVRDYSHRYGADVHIDEASFFQTAGIPGVMDETESVEVPCAVDTDIIAHRVLLIIAAKVAAGETHISLKKGLREFGLLGEAAVYKELDVLHVQKVFAPQDPSTLSKEERSRALESLMFLERKRTGTVKGRLVADGSKQRDYIQEGAAASPTVMTESVLITAAIEATEGRDVAVIDLPGAFLNAHMDEVVHMVLRGKLAELMVKFAPQIYRKYVTLGVKGEPMLYVTLQKALYGCLRSALLFYLKLVADLEGQGFRLNPYDPCVANKVIDGGQMTLTFHVDDIKISHRDPAQVDDLIDWFKSIYGSNVRVSRGRTHDYLGMMLSYSDGKVRISMADYVKKVIAGFPEDIHGVASTPAGENLFQVREEDKRILLEEERAQSFHSTVAQLLFVTLRCRRDIQTAVSFLTTRVKEPDEDDWSKLRRVLKYLHGTVYLSLTLDASNMKLVRWWVDASFAVHPDYRSHTGAVLSLGKGAVTSLSRKQRLNTRSSTEAEIVGVDDASAQILWTNYFIRAQGYVIDSTTVYQDNQSAILLETNGKQSSGKRTRHMNIRYFFITDRVKSGEMTIGYCPATKMIGDHFTKPLQGALFRRFRAVIMNVDEHVPDADLAWDRDNIPVMPQECLGERLTLVMMTCVSLAAGV